MKIGIAALLAGPAGPIADELKYTNANDIDFIEFAAILSNAMRRIQALEAALLETSRVANRTAYEASVRANGGIPD